MSTETTTTQPAANNVPEGYMKDRKGRLVPLAQVPAHDLEMDTFVRKHIAGAISIQRVMSEFKKSVFGDCHAFLALLDEKFNAKRGGQKGNVTFSTYDGEQQIIIKVSDVISLGPEIQSAKVIIDECIADWSKGADENLMAIVNDAFVVDRQGKLSMSRILGLLRLDIKDERWPQVKEAIKDAIICNETKCYINFRQRDDEGKLVNIPLDMAAL